MNDEIKYPISEIFTSVQGEGVYSGVMMTFIRLAGCTVGKPYKESEKLIGNNIDGFKQLPVYTEKCTLYDGREFPCFLTGTKVPIAKHGKYIRRIIVDDLKAGDKILSWTKKGTKVGIVKRVHEKWVNEDELVSIVVQNSQGTKHSFVVTENHEFLDTDFNWIRADNLKLTMELHQANGLADITKKHMSNVRIKGIKDGSITIPALTKEAKKDIRKRMIECNPMKDPKVVERSMQGHWRRPTGPEKKVIRIASDVGVNVRYTGDNGLFIHGKGKVRNPDFIIPNTSKVIEVYDSSFKYKGKQRDNVWVKDTKRYYGQCGYECLVLDTSKLSNDSIGENLIQFSGNGLKIMKLQRGLARGRGRWLSKSVRRGDGKIKVIELSIKKYHNYVGPCRTVNHNCDTDYRVHGRLTTQQISSSIPENITHVCITGGEPCMHNIMDLIPQLTDNGKRQIHIETSGTINWYLKPTWITVSPKKGVTHYMLDVADELKLLVDEKFNPEELIPDTLVLPTTIAKQKPTYLHPVNFEKTINPDNVKLCRMWQDKYPQFRIGLQLHKALSLFTENEVR